MLQMKDFKKTGILVIWSQSCIRFLKHRVDHCLMKLPRNAIKFIIETEKLYTIMSPFVRKLARMSIMDKILFPKPFITSDIQTFTLLNQKHKDNISDKSICFS